MSETPRFPAHLEVSALIRQVEATGGFAAVLHRGERDGGTLMMLVREAGGAPRLFERMPRPDGSRQWDQARIAASNRDSEFEDYLDRRVRQDPDVWIIELDVANLQRFVQSLG